ncbi:MAG: hydroxymethylbilane synthase [Acidobacteria bacterium]|nr:hydroxymethylbilane synthase [Acidobacteriota bacterium]
MSELVIGSRGSKLALWQAGHIAAKLTALGHSVRIEVIHTTGDKITDVALSKVGTKGIFTKEIEEALLAKTIDLAVHSAKDMPTELPAGLTLAAFPEREDARDVLVGSTFAGLPKGAVVGTSSLRRAAQLRGFRSDLDIQDLRGNVDTRLRKQAEGQYAAIVLAAAGLIRLGLQDRVTEYFDPMKILPAVGQGALAIETRDDNGPGHQAALALDDPATRACVTAERATLRTFGGGCTAPLGAYAVIGEDGVLRIRGVLIAPSGRMEIKSRAEGPPSEADAIGTEMGENFIEAGGREMILEINT